MTDEGRDPNRPLVDAQIVAETEIVADEKTKFLRYTLKVAGTEEKVQLTAEELYTARKTAMSAIEKEVEKQVLQEKKNLLRGGETLKAAKEIWAKEQGGYLTEMELHIKKREDELDAVQQELARLQGVEHIPLARFTTMAERKRKEDESRPWFLTTDREPPKNTCGHPDHKYLCELDDGTQHLLEHIGYSSYWIEFGTCGHGPGNVYRSKDQPLHERGEHEQRVVRWKEVPLDYKLGDTLVPVKAPESPFKSSEPKPTTFSTRWTSVRQAMPKADNCDSPQHKYEALLHSGGKVTVQFIGDVESDDERAHTDRLDVWIDFGTCGHGPTNEYSTAKRGRHVRDGQHRQMVSYWREIPMS